MLGVMMTKAERRLVDAIVRAKNARLVEVIGAEPFTSSSLVRKLIVREARAEGLLPDEPTLTPPVVVASQDEQAVVASTAPTEPEGKSARLRHMEEMEELLGGTDDGPAGTRKP
jgi:hypothetical protein